MVTAEVTAEVMVGEEVTAEAGGGGYIKVFPVSYDEPSTSYGPPSTSYGPPPSDSYGPPPSTEYGAPSSGHGGEQIGSGTTV